MFLFLGTEVLFFGALFAAYTVYRFTYPHVWAAGSHELMMWAGAADTAILILSSFCVAMAVHTAQSGGSPLAADAPPTWRARDSARAFLVLHGYEYYRDFTEHHVPGGHFVWNHDAPGNKVDACSSHSYFLDDRPCTASTFSSASASCTVMACAGVASEIHAGILHAGRGFRPLLALRRSGLGVPVPPLLPYLVTPH